ncbi:MAG: hypothetical protein IH595_03410 [Bacteroidales bacterium]|nr:hypothetical protein [Bacteroidales bacterium]
MKSILKILLLSSLATLMAFSCEKGKQVQQEEQQKQYVTYKAKGTIIDIFNDGCNGDWLMIEVSNPKNIGLSGITPTKKGPVKYENAIAVPFFSKLGLPDDIPDTVGTWLYFEYRNLEKGENKLFLHLPVELCYPDYVSPPAMPYIITKIIDYH